MLTLPVLKAAGVVAVLYFLFQPKTASADHSKTTAADPPPQTFPDHGSIDDPPPAPGGSVTILGGSCADDRGNPAPCKQGSWDYGSDGI